MDFWAQLSRPPIDEFAEVKLVSVVNDGHVGNPVLDLGVDLVGHLVVSLVVVVVASHPSHQK